MAEITENDKKLETWVVDSLRNRDCVFLLGAGVSMAVAPNSAKSWKDLIASGFTYANKYISNPHFSDSWLAKKLDDLESAGSFDLMTLAMEVERALFTFEKDKPYYGAWLDEEFSSFNVENPLLLQVIRQLAEYNIRIPVLTTNFDSSAADQLDTPVVLRSDSEEFFNLFTHGPGVGYIHGHWRDPESLAFGYSGYSKLIEDERFRTLMKTLVCKPIICVGCMGGLKDDSFEILHRELRRLAQSAGSPWPSPFVALVCEEQFESASSLLQSVQVNILVTGKGYDSIPRYLTKLGIMAEIPVNDQLGTKPASPNADTHGKETEIPIPAFPSEIVAAAGGTRADNDDGTASSSRSELTSIPDLNVNQVRLRALSLFKDIDLERDGAIEVRELALFFECSEIELLAWIREVERTNHGARNGRYHETPLDKDSRDRTVESLSDFAVSPAVFSAKLDNHRLLRSMLRRIDDVKQGSKTLEIEDASARVVNEWVNSHMASIEPSSLTDEETKTIHKVIETTPRIGMNVLSRLIPHAASGETLPEDEVEKLERFAQSLIEIAQFGEHFERAEEMLYDLVVLSNRTNGDANIVEDREYREWRKLFQVALSNTAYPFDRRMELLQRRLSQVSYDPVQFEVCLNGLFSCIVRDIEGGVVPRSIVGGRIAPEEDKPENITYGSIADEFSQMMQTAKWASAANLELKNTIAHAIVDNSYNMIRQVLPEYLSGVEDYLPSISRLPVEKRFEFSNVMKRYTEEVGEYLEVNEDEHGNLTKAVELANTWHQTVGPENDLEKLVWIALDRDWKRTTEDDDGSLSVAAKLIVKDYNLISPFDSWCRNNNNEHLAAELASRVYTFDSSRELFDLCVQAKVNDPNCRFQWSFIFDWVKNAENKEGVIAELEALIPHVAAALYARLVTSSAGFEGVVRCAENTQSDRGGLDGLRQLSFGPWIEILDESQVLALAERINRAADLGYTREASNVAIQFLYWWGNEKSGAKLPKSFWRALAPRIEDTDVEKNSLMRGRDHAYVIELAFDQYDPAFAMRLAMQEFKEESYWAYGTYMPIVAKFASMRPRLFLEEFDRVEPSVSPLRDTLAPVLLEISEKEVLDRWYESKEDENAKHEALVRIAPHIPSPRVGDNDKPEFPSALSWFMEKGKDVACRNAFLDSKRIFSWSSSDNYGELRRVFEPLQEHEHPLIRNWAKQYIKDTAWSMKQSRGSLREMLEEHERE